MDAKKTILEISSNIGFERAVIGALDPMEEECKEFISWLERGYAAGMEYLKRNPHFRTSPRLLYPQASSAIVVMASYYTEPPEYPGEGFGRVARYAVGLDYHAVLRAKLRLLKGELEKALGRPILGKAYSDDVALYEQAYARASGLGFAGKNTLIIGPRLSGSYHFVAELFCDLELEPDEPYQGTCGQCFRCGVVCPTGAIVEAGTVDAGLCISYLTIENKEGIPLALRPKMGDWVFGCDLCQMVCPYNQRPPQTPFAEFRPESGAGHYLDLVELLKIGSEIEFRARFGSSPLRRPKRRGLLRNALVVLGNQKPDSAWAALAEFALCQTDPMLREHAAWALFQYGGKRSRAVIEQMLNQESDAALKNCLATYI